MTTGQLNKPYGLAPDDMPRDWKALADQQSHTLKQLRDAMDCDGSDLPQLLAKWDELRASYEEMRQVLAWASENVRACGICGIDNHRNSALVGDKFYYGPTLYEALHEAWKERKQ